jgi:uncharacterized membrane protein
LWLYSAPHPPETSVVGGFLLDAVAKGAEQRQLHAFVGLGGALVGIGYAYRRLRPLQQERPPTAPV